MGIASCDKDFGIWIRKEFIQGVIESQKFTFDPRIILGFHKLDFINQEKSIVLANEGIRFTCFLDASLLNYIPKESLYSLFENALSNAIEAVRPLPEEKRVISVIGSNFKDYFTIHMENYCKDDKPLTSLETTKEDKSNHGFGLKSIFMIMNQYDGKYKLTKKDGVFSLDLLFRIPSKEEGQEGI